MQPSAGLVRGTVAGEPLLYVPGLPGCCLNEFPQLCCHLSDCTLVGLPYADFVAGHVAAGDFAACTRVGIATHMLSRLPGELLEQFDVRIVAYSVGTLVAVELARLLQASGRVVQALVLLDAPVQPDQGVVHAGLSAVFSRLDLVRARLRHWFGVNMRGTSFPEDTLAWAAASLWGQLATTAEEAGAAAKLDAPTLHVKAADSQGAAELVSLDLPERQRDFLREALERALRRWTGAGGHHVTTACTHLLERTVPGRHLSFLVDPRHARRTLHVVADFLALVGSAARVGLDIGPLIEQQQPPCADHSVSQAATGTLAEVEPIVSADELGLEYSLLMGLLESRCEEYGLSPDVAMPLLAREGLDRLFDGLRRGRNRAVMLPKLAMSLQNLIESRVRLLSGIARHPEMLHTLVRPVFIVGVNRTGTTLLHRAMFASGKVNALLGYEINLVPDLDNAASAAYDNARMNTFTIGVGAMKVDEMHETGFDLPEEELMVFDHAFASLNFPMQFDVPGYREWLDQQPLREVYKEHHAWVCYTAWLRRLRGAPSVSGAPWLFKFPWHLRTLPALLAQYPDALFIQTHRKPEEYTASWCRLTEAVRSNNGGLLDREEHGREQLHVLQTLVDRCSSFRRSNPQLESRWLDVQFEDLVRDPVGIIAGAFRHIGLPCDEPEVERIRAYVTDSHAKNRAAKAADRKRSQAPTLGEYGLDPEAVRAALR